MAGGEAVRLGLLLVAVFMLTGASSAPLVIDGDTIVSGEEHVRISNLDAPDIGSHAKCAREAARGWEARRYAVALIRGASSIEVVRREGLDRYGRTLARVLVDGRDFARLMIGAGHGRPWRGRSSNWCNDSLM
jgi:micrococcal nuclease